MLTQLYCNLISVIYSMENLSRRNLLQLLASSSMGITATPALEFFSNVIAEDPKPVLIPPGGGKKGKIGDNDITFKLSKDQTSGNLGSAEMTLLPRHLAAPPHYHKGFDEICIVLEGTIHVMVEEEIFKVEAGGWHLRPRGKVHTFWNSEDKTARVIELYTPAGHEAYMQNLTSLFVNGNRPKPGDLQNLSKKHDIIFSFDKLQAIMEKHKVHL